MRALARLEALQGAGDAALDAQAADWEALLQAGGRRLRRRIAAGRCPREALRRAFRRLAGEPDSPGGYDALDVLVAGLLGDGPPPEPRRALEAEMVFYQPSPARIVLELCEQSGLKPGQLFFDLGSGLGQVAILVALLSGAVCRGIEWEPAYVEQARRSAQGLGAPGVGFAQADARTADLDGGDAYFLYTPFKGAMLQQVLARLRAQAAQRPITLCSFGPCTQALAAQAWLKPQAGTAFTPTELGIFFGGPPGAA